MAARGGRQIPPGTGVSSGCEPPDVGAKKQNPRSSARATSTQPGGGTGLKGVPLIPALERQMQADIFEFEASLVYKS